MLIIAAVILLGVFFFSTLYFRASQEEKVSGENNRDRVSQPLGENQKNTGAIDAGTIQGDIIVMPTIDYKDLNKNKELQQLMVARKEKLGIKHSLDMIVHSDETFKIGDNQISMRDITDSA